VSEKQKTGPNFPSHIKPQHQTLKITVHLVDVTDGCLYEEAPFSLASLSFLLIYIACFWVSMCHQVTVFSYNTLNDLAVSPL